MGTQSQTPIPFTTTLRRFEEDDTPMSVENFFAINGTTVVFNANLVESISILPLVRPGAIAVRLNNRDGTCFDKHFRIDGKHVSEAPPFVPKAAVLRAKAA